MAAGFSVKDALNKNSKAGIDESPRADKGHFNFQDVPERYEFLQCRAD